jgi:hypothetical protein
VVSGWDQTAVDDRDLVEASTSDRGQSQQRADGVDDPMRGGMRDAQQRADLTQGQVGTPAPGYVTSIGLQYFAAGK